MKYCHALLAVILFFLFGCLMIYKINNTFPNELKIATADKLGAYYYFAQKYQKVLKEEGIDLKIVQTKGSFDALKHLSEKDVDIAFVQGGTASKYKDKNLISLASIFYEPLWVFYKKDLNIIHLSDLKNYRISIGAKGSGTNELCKTLLIENSVNNLNKLYSYSNEEVLEKLKNNQLDAVCIVVSAQSKIIKELSNLKDMELMSFNRNLAYKVKYHFINSIVLGEGVIDLYENKPSSDKKLLVTTASLVVRADFNQNLQNLIIRKVEKIHKEGGFLDPKGFFPSIEFVDLPISENTKAYLQNGPSWIEEYLPFWLFSFIEQSLIIVLPLIPLIIILIKMIFPSYSLYIKHKIFLYEQKLYNIEEKVDEKLDESEIAEINKLKKSIERDCIVYFLYTQTYYLLILKLYVLKKRLTEYNNKF
ncbi:hypothetical protein CRV08_04575 [Halarcobacter ebronensis]|uniref:C4-dicarboxylate ABC transporter substrate-binding protein n=1 Tax=Halarcobacter ebronensis TaxID=1462615 RepID=A0A4V1LRT2_9BACT|nr:TAXI family TRAP transporter solute-binding subunit [Halarcobacter ebronensis]RXJ69288.1 hypothetical protein CRV08_04575 [Halarcobacter ebronensis]